MVQYKNSEDYERRGFELLESGRLQEAAALFRQATELFPFTGEFYSGLGQAYSEMGEYFLAARAFQKGLTYSPCDEEMWFGLGMCLLQLNRLQEAESCFERIEDRIHEDPDVLMQLAFAYYHIDCPEEAVSYCQEILERQPDHPEALAMLGVCLEETEQAPEEARQNLSRAIELQPERWDWVEYYANLLYEDGDCVKAFHYMDKIPLSSIRNQDSLKRLIKLLKKFRQDPQKIQNCRQRASEIAESENFEKFLFSLQDAQGPVED